MPILPRYIAQQPVEAGIRLPPRVAAPDVGEAIIQSWGPAARMFEDAQAKLKAQQDEIDFARMQGEYHAGMEDLRLNLQTDPDYLGRERKFFQGAKAIQDKLIQSARDPDVQKAFTAYALKRTPMEAVGVRAESLKLWIGAQKDQLAMEGDDSAKRASIMPSEELRTEEQDRYFGMLDRALARGIYQPVEVGKIKRVYRETVLDKQMDVLRRTDPQQMLFMVKRGAFKDLDPIRVLTHLEQARKDQEAEAARNEQFVKAMVDNELMILNADANEAKISEARMERGLRGLDPIVKDPVKWRELKRVQDNPPLGGENLPARVIIQEYRSGSMTMPRINEARRRLNALALEIGRPSDVISKALNELQTDENTVRGLQYQAIQANIKVAEDDYDAKNPPSPFAGFLGRAKKNADEVNKSTIRNEVRKGADPKTTVDKVIQQEKAKYDAIPSRNKNVLDQLE